ncbi:transposase [Mycobacterium marinum]|uniref:transposase n=1 Tax=Mycobacterium marinum TaxID=1781 RepID=UPI002358BBC3|nr:transposase [Mycobacterium marinum]MDC8985618.1 transposase [Mycobacterium marinum]MDC9002905.1 transposase [Mycobacterium marinum]MDC9013645.1 transposase [Mycobacterium marinum]MDC9019006.1 transposase [Mycobacterium marinum]
MRTRAAQARGIWFADTAEGVLDALTTAVVETVLNQELYDHRRQDNPDPAGRDGGKSRKNEVLTATAGEIGIPVPPYREGSFDPQLIRKHQRRSTRADENVLSLYAQGLTTGKIAAPFAELHEAKISPNTISGITDTIVAVMADRASRQWEPVCAAIFIARKRQGPRRPSRQPSVLRRHRR